MFHSMMLSAHLVFGYMVSDIWLRATHIMRKETCHHLQTLQLKA